MELKDFNLRQYWDYSKRKYESFLVCLVGWFLQVLCLEVVSCPHRCSSSSSSSPSSPHPIKLLCMKTAGVKLHVLTVVFMQSQLVYSVPPGCRSVPDNVTTEGGEHRTASS